MPRAPTRLGLLWRYIPAKIRLSLAMFKFYFRHWSFTMRHWSFTFDILVTLFNIYFSFATYDHVNSNNKNTVSRCKMVVFQAPFVFHVCM